MSNSTLRTKGILAIALLAAIAAVQAEPGDDDPAVIKARKDYAEAMKTHDVGLQNAMKIELSVAVAKARESAARKDAANAGHRVD